MAKFETTILSDANELVHKVRNDAYGDPHDDFKRIIGAANALLADVIRERVNNGEHPLATEDWPLLMNCAKMSREVHSPDKENRIDGAGYWATLDMVHSATEARTVKPSPPQTRR